jgi:hypothetical protein
LKRDGRADILGKKGTIIDSGQKKLYILASRRNGLLIFIFLRAEWDKHRTWLWHVWVGPELILNLLLDRDLLHRQVDRETGREQRQDNDRKCESPLRFWVPVLIDHKSS